MGIKITENTKIPLRFVSYLWEGMYELNTQAGNSLYIFFLLFILCVCVFIVSSHTLNILYSCSTVM